MVLKGKSGMHALVSDGLQLSSYGVISCSSFECIEPFALDIRKLNVAVFEFLKWSISSISNLLLLKDRI